MQEVIEKIEWKARIFVSYSRKDSVAARKLIDAFKEMKYDVWVDWEDIPTRGHRLERTGRCRLRPPHDEFFPSAVEQFFRERGVSGVVRGVAGAVDWLIHIIINDK